MLEIQFYTQFKRDVKRAKKRHMDMSLLKYVIDKLQACEPLEEKYRDHALGVNMPAFESAISSQTGCWYTKS